MSSVTLWLLLAAVAVGAAVPMQSAINAQMAATQGHPLYGAITNTGVATLCFVVLIAVLRIPPPNLRAAGGASWWLWSGGFIGAALFAAATIFGTAVASLIIDHYGLFGFHERPLSALRLAGAACLLLGIALLQAAR